MGDTAMNVPITVRSHELAQLQEFLPDVRDGLQQAEMGEMADTIDRIYDEHVSGVRYEKNDTYVSMPAEDWKTVVRNIGRLSRTSEGTRAWWLQRKLIKRLDERLEEMD